MILFLPFLMLGFVYLLNRRQLKENYYVLNPVSVNVFIWGFVLAVHTFYFPYGEYTLKTYGLILSGIMFMAVGFWIFCRKRIILGKHGYKSARYIYREKGLLWTLRFLLCIETVRVIYSIYIIVYRLAGSWDVFFSSNTYVRNLYLSYNGGTLANIFEFFCNTNAFTGYVLVGIFFAKRYKHARGIFFAWSVLEMIYALITMSKMCFIVYIIVVSVTYLNNLGSLQKQRKIIKKYFPVVAVGILFFLMAIGIQRNYMANGELLLSTVLRKAAIYLAGPTEALGRYISQYKSEYTMGSGTLKIFFRILSRLGISHDLSVLAHGKNIDIGYESINVYTWFQVFYQDFSYMGIVVIPMILGCVAGIFYSQSDESLIANVWNSWITAVFAMSFYTFMWGQTIYLFTLFYAYIFHIALHKTLYQVK